MDSRGDCVLCRRQRERLERRETLARDLRRLILLAVFLGAVAMVGTVDPIDFIGPKIPRTKPMDSPMESDSQPTSMGAESLEDAGESTESKVEIDATGDASTVSMPDAGRGSLGAQERIQESLTPSQAARVTGGSLGKGLAAARARVQIRLYVAKNCADCVRARSYMTQSGIPFTELDVEKDPQARKERDQLNPIKTVPTIQVGEEVLPRFEPIELELTINRAARNRP